MNNLRPRRDPEKTATCSGALFASLCAHVIKIGLILIAQANDIGALVLSEDPLGSKLSVLESGEASCRHA